MSDYYFWGSNMQDRTYEPPKLTVIGTVEQLTAGLKHGAALDKSFPNNTPFSSLTFS